MGTIARQAHDGLITAAIFVAVAASVPLVAVLAFALRPVLLAVAAAALLAFGLCYAFSEAFRESERAGTLPRVEPRGLRLPGEVMLDSGHCWARIEDGDEVAVGVNDLVQATLGPLDDVEPPRVGEGVRRGDHLFRIRHGSRSVDFKAPVTGTVIAVNEALAKNATLVNRKPYSDGWVVRLKGEQLNEDRPRLLQGMAARTWLDAEADRILAVLRSLGAQTLPSSSHDLPVKRLYCEIDDTAWSRLTETMLATRPAPLEPAA